MLPTFRRFTVSDIPTAPDWISSVFNPLNIFCEQTVQTLNKNLVFGQNVQGAKFTTSFTTLSTYATGGFSTINFAYTGGGQPDCCIIGSITRTDSSTPIIVPVSVSNWTLNINVNPMQVNINYIAGLVASAKYTATFIVL